MSSAATAATAPRPVPPRPARSAGRDQTRLELVPDRAPGPSRLAFLLLIVALLCVGLVALLGFNTALAQGSFTVRDLQARASAQSDRSQALEEQIARAAAPGPLAKSAREIGMVPAPRVGHLNLAAGTVTGKPPVTEGAPPPLTPQQRAEAQARRVAAEQRAAERTRQRDAREAQAAAAAAERRRVAAEQQRLAAERAAAERAAAEAAAEAERARKQWQARLAEQGTGTRGGGEQVVTPPEQR